MPLRTIQRMQQRMPTISMTTIPCTATTMRQRPPTVGKSATALQMF